MEANCSGCEKSKYRVHLNGSLLFCCHCEVSVPRAAAVNWCAIQTRPTGQVAFECTSSPPELPYIFVSALLWAGQWPGSPGKPCRMHTWQMYIEHLHLPNTFVSSLLSWNSQTWGNIICSTCFDFGNSGFLTSHFLFLCSLVLNVKLWIEYKLDIKPNIQSHKFAQRISKSKYPVCCWQVWSS